MLSVLSMCSRLVVSGQLGAPGAASVALEDSVWPVTHYLFHDGGLGIETPSETAVRRTAETSSGDSSGGGRWTQAGARRDPEEVTVDGSRAEGPVTPAESAAARLHTPPPPCRAQPRCDVQRLDVEETRRRGDAETWGRRGDRRGPDQTAGGSRQRRVWPHWV